MLTKRMSSTAFKIAVKLSVDIFISLSIIRNNCETGEFEQAYNYLYGVKEKNRFAKPLISTAMRKKNVWL